MDTRKLKAFVAVAEELHFGRAARRLHVSQPPLSLTIRTLERELGVRLLERTSRKVLLTEPGKVLLEEARALLRQLGEAERRTLEAERGERGALAIGFITPAIYAFLPDLLREYRARFPGVRLSLREATEDAQLEQLERGALSAGFVFAERSVAGLAAERATLGLESALVHREPLLAALPARHALARARTPLRLAGLADQPFVMFPRLLAPGLFDQIIGFCRAAGVTPRIEQEAVQSQTIVALVAAGLGVAIVPASIARLRRPGVVYRRLSERSPSVGTFLVWQRDGASRALSQFVKLALAQRTR